MKLLIAVMTAHRLDYFVDDQTVDWLNAQGLRYLNVDKRRAALRGTWLSPAGIPTSETVDIDYKFFFGQQLRRLDIKPNQRIGTGGPAPELPKPLADEVYLPCGDGYIFNSAKMKEICRYAVAHGYDYILRVDDDTFVNLPKLLATDWSEYAYSGAATGAFHPGSCMFLSRDAMQRVTTARITSYCDDLWVGTVMDTAGIERHDIESIIHGFGRDYAIRYDRVKNIDFSAVHSCTPDVMAELWTLQNEQMSTQQVEKQLSSMLPETRVQSQTTEVSVPDLLPVISGQLSGEGTT